jgi:hypothetical protein
MDEVGSAISDLEKALKLGLPQDKKQQVKKKLAELRRG